jgi:hypothetical protein
MKVLFALMAVLLAAAPLATAQEDSEVELWVAGYRLAADGPEMHAGVSWGPGKLTVGKSSIGIFSMRDCGYFTAATSANPFEENATAGWRVEITPIKIVDHAVTFRLRWTRAIDRSSNDLSPSSEDVQVTLRPGESRPLDSVPVAPGSKTLNSRPCDARAASLRVALDHPAFDRRLIGANIWLVERLPNGKEQSQLQSLRGLPNRAIPFYFDSVADGSKRIDFFGKLVADPEQGTVEVALETVRGVADPGPQGYQAAHWFRSTVQIKPNEIVEVALRQPGDAAAPPGTRVFSLRIQAKQLR